MIVPLGACTRTLTNSAISDAFSYVGTWIRVPSDLSLLQTGARSFFDSLKAGGVAHRDPVPIY